MPKSVSRALVYNRGGQILEPGDTVAVKYVTVVGYANDFAVYMGFPELGDNEIASYGDKVGEDVGRAVAPYCSHLAYRP